MNNSRYVTGLVFAVIATAFISTHMLFKPIDHDLVWVQVPQASPGSGGSISSVAAAAAVSLESSDIQAAFERDTVIRLNRIVRRSLSTIRQYDAEINTIRTENLAAARDGMSDRQLNAARANIVKIQNWLAEATQAVNDMNAAVIELEASDEHHNTAILAGMVRFVNTVAEEIGAEHARLSEQNRLALL